MAALEGDFQIDDFLDPESDFARGVNLASERFADGEPGYILVEGDIANPLVLEAIEELRRNINSHGEVTPIRSPELQQAKWNFWGWTR